jgi:hypothetical protein
MKNIRRRFGSLAAIAIVIMPLLITVYLLYWSPNDLSARQTGKQCVFGATCMTMNNPYFQMLDTQIQGLPDLNDDVLLTRDAAMDQERQNQEIQELVDAGVCAIFMTPVEWDTSKECVQIAANAGVPVIVVDAPIQDSELAACSVLSDNYQAGVLCTHSHGISPLPAVAEDPKLLRQIQHDIPEGSGFSPEMIRKIMSNAVVVPKFDRYSQAIIMAESAIQEAASNQLGQSGMLIAQSEINIFLNKS